MRSIRLLAVAVLAVVAALSATQNVFAAVIDQKQELFDSAAQILFNSPIGQEFQPSLNRLEAVEVRIGTINHLGDDTITLTVREGSISGMILATSTQSVADGFDGWVYFSLTPISVTLGSTYVIQLSATKATHEWWRKSNTNPYPNGRAIVGGNPQDNNDMTFRTYGSTATSPSVGGVVIPPNTFALVSPWLAVIGLVGCIATVVVVAKKRRH